MDYPVLSPSLLSKMDFQSIHANSLYTRDGSEDVFTSVFGWYFGWCQHFDGKFCVVVTDSLPDRSCLMREPACQRFDQFHPEMPVVCTVRQLQGPSRPTTLPGFLFLSSFGASQSFPVSSYSIPHQICRYIQDKGPSSYYVSPPSSSFSHSFFLFSLPI